MAAVDDYDKPFDEQVRAMAQRLADVVPPASVEWQEWYASLLAQARREAAAAARRQQLEADLRRGRTREGRRAQATGLPVPPELVAIRHDRGSP